ncbi:hypothetical protein HZA55_06720 [Candidatus Poribacteria bacterium]|nr:hypothetical protein [Candidatus Poribacteria bacterium]
MSMLNLKIYLVSMPLTESLDDIPNSTPVVDGGVFANNPTACAFVEAIKKGRSSGVPIEEIVILSLGTGR